MSALLLKIIACTAMLLDHIGYFWNIYPLRIIGRIAFPIFVYMIYNGYRHTSSKWKYALRMGIFAVVSQIPFSLFCCGRLFYNNGNVFFTLLAALLCLWSVDVMRKHRVLRWCALLPTVAVCILYYFGIFASDYGAVGVLMILVFYFCDRKGWGWKLLTVFGFFCAVYYMDLLAAAKAVCLLVLGKNSVLPALDQWTLTQAFSGFALPLIFVYSGKKGNVPGGKITAKLVQYGFYLFYPAHMLVLYLLVCIIYLK